MSQGMSLINIPIYENGRIVVMVKALGLGDYLPKFAGNLDIMTSAARACGERMVKSLS